MNKFVLLFSLFLGSFQVNAQLQLDVVGTSNEEGLVVTDQGRTGVGTRTPGAKFMVVGQAGAPVINVLGPNDAGTNPSLRVNEDGNVGVGISTPGAKFMIKGTGTNPTLNIVTSTGTAPALRVNDNEHVGIGTAAPLTKFHVSSGDVYLDNSMNGVILTAPNGDCFKVTVANGGALTSTAMTCP